MKLVDFCRAGGIEHWQRMTIVCMVKYNMAERYTFITKINLTISSSKQSFEEETSSSIFDNVNLKMTLAENILMACGHCLILLKTKP